LRDAPAPQPHGLRTGLRRIAAAALAAWALVAASALPGAQGATNASDAGGLHIMSEFQSEAAKLIRLSDDRFFSTDEGALSALRASLASAVERHRGKKPPPGTPRPPLPETVAIGAPAALDLGARDSFPLLLAAVRSGQREWEVHARQNQLLLLSHLGTAIVDVMAPVDAGRRMPVYPPSRSGPPPDTLNAAAGYADVRRYDLLKWFQRDTLSGPVALTYIEYDRVSNTVMVDITPARDAAPASRRPPQRIATQPSASPGAQQVGRQLTFTLPEVVGGSSPAALNATARLHRSEVTAVTAPPGSQTPLVLGGALLLVKLDDASPQLVHLILPGRPAQVDGAEAVESSFSLDLPGVATSRNLSGPYLAYLVVGAAVSGPRPVAFGAAR